MLKLANKDPTNVLKKIYDNVLEQHPSFIVPDYKSVRISLYRKRSEKVPPVPKTIRDIEFRGRWRNSYARARFLIYHNVGFGVTIFATDDGMRVLLECDNILCDGTFKACPSPYYQLYVIVRFWENRFIPLVFSFLSGKTTFHYRKLFEIICRRVRRITGQAWVPQGIITDYERGVISVLETDFPEVEHAGCFFFHFTQAIYRNVCGSGLKRPYEENEAVKRIIRLLMASAHLPENQVCDAISELLQEREVIEATRQFPELVKVYQCFHRTWIMTFPPKLWNVYDRPLRLRTTNFCEGWDNTWNRKIQRNSPNFWTAVRFLKQQQRETEIKIALARREFRAPTQQKK